MPRPVVSLAMRPSASTRMRYRPIAQGILAGPAALYMFAQSIQRLGVARAAVFPAIVPALTLLLGWLLIGEPPTTLQAAGLITVLAGFYLAQRQSWPYCRRR